MTNHGYAMRSLAEKYLRLASTSDNPRERSKFIDYAMLYAQLSEQARRHEEPLPPRPEAGHVSRRHAYRR